MSRLRFFSIRRPALGRLLAAAAAAALWFAAPVQARHIEVDLELLLAVDISGSIDPEEAKLQRQGYVEAFRDPVIVKAILGGYHGRISVAFFEWSDAWRQQTLVDWTLLDSEAAVRAFADTLSKKPITVWTRTSISGAMRYAVPMFERSPYRGERRVLDISGDGSNNDGGLVTAAREEALMHGIVVNGLPIMNDRPNPFGFPTETDLDRYYEGCVIGGPRSFIVVARSFADFDDAVRKKILLEITDAAPDVPAVRHARLAAAASDAAEEPSYGEPLAEAPRDYRNYVRPAFDLGCDIGEKRSREFWQRRFNNPN